MPELFQRLFAQHSSEVRSLNAQAALGPVLEPERSQWSLLFRHFLARFFHHESASPDGDAKARLVLIALTVGLPGFIIALFLWPIFHPVLRLPSPHWPPYWWQVNLHLFYVIYSFAITGIATVFEWDLFFPDLLDVFVLSTLPIPRLRLFAARVAAITALLAGFLVNANIFAAIALPVATDPPSFFRFVGLHVLAVIGSGLFAATSVLAVQGVLLSLLGERWFRRISLALQALSIAAFVLTLLLFPVLSYAVPAFLNSGHSAVLLVPPLWFLGIYQRLLEGPACPAIYARLAHVGYLTTLGTTALAALSYPMAYVRKVRQLVEGSGPRRARGRVRSPWRGMLSALCLRHPLRRAVFHFIGRTLAGVPRYRIYLVLYGGVGLSVVIATVLRLTVDHGLVRVQLSADGVRAAVGIVAFWTIAGLRMAFTSSGNRQGGWIFRAILGRPPETAAAMHQLLAARIWALLCASTMAGATLLVLLPLAPAELRGFAALASQVLVACGMCLLLTDLLFMNVVTTAFTGEVTGAQTSLAATLLRYVAFLPAVAVVPVSVGLWAEHSGWSFLLTAAAIAALHWLIERQHRIRVREYCARTAYEEGDDDMLTLLGLSS